MNNTAPIYRVTVGNIGEVYAGNISAEARAAFNTYKAQSLADLILRIETRHTVTA